jgi:hypothetical protein
MASGIALVDFVLAVCCNGLLACGADCRPVFHALDVKHKPLEDATKSSAVAGGVLLEMPELLLMLKVPCALKPARCTPASLLHCTTA